VDIDMVTHIQNMAYLDDKIKNMCEATYSRHCALKAIKKVGELMNKGVVVRGIVMSH
jgi:hypothetical protein